MLNTRLPHAGTAYIGSTIAVIVGMFATATTSDRLLAFAALITALGGFVVGLATHVSGALKVRWEHSRLMRQIELDDKARKESVDWDRKQIEIQLQQALTRITVEESEMTYLQEELIQARVQINLLKSAINNNAVKIEGVNAQSRENAAKLDRVEQQSGELRVRLESGIPFPPEVPTEIKHPSDYPKEPPTEVT